MRSQDPRWKKIRQLYKDKARTVLIKAKSRPCADCEIQYPYYVMQFDHVRGKKIRPVSAMDKWGIPLLVAEIAKCDVVCANCHAERTQFRRLLKHVS